MKTAMQVSGPEASSYLGGCLDGRFVGHGSCQNWICNGRVHGQGILFTKVRRQGSGMGWRCCCQWNRMQGKENVGQQVDDTKKKKKSF
jgi:hypothetical protein